jgi:hypothetical protein
MKRLSRLIGFCYATLCLGRLPVGGTHGSVFFAWHDSLRLSVLHAITGRYACINSMSSGAPRGLQSRKSVRALAADCLSWAGMKTPMESAGLATCPSPQPLRARAWSSESHRLSNNRITLSLSLIPTLLPDGEEHYLPLSAGERSRVKDDPGVRYKRHEFTLFSLGRRCR